MLKKKCPKCTKKIERKYNFCPYCGFYFRKSEQDEFGLLGKDDFIKEVQQGMQMPMGLDKVMNSLIKRLDKELGMGGGGFNIQITTGMPRMPPHQTIKQSPQEEITNEEIEKRKKLPKKEAESVVRRFSDKIIYEIKVPGVKSKKDVIISKMESGFEIKAYGSDKCYVKTIPVKVEITKVILKDDILFLEMKD